MIPLKIEAEFKKIPFVTILLIILCFVVFYKRDLLTLFTHGLVPLDFVHSLFHPAELTGTIAALLLSFFLHGGIIHLLSNMWFLWIFGGAVEARTGSFTFAIMYFLFGTVSMLTQVGSSPLSTIPIVGASGAIAGIMGMCLIFFPFSWILMWFPPIFIFKLPSFLFLLLWFILQFVNLGNPQTSSGGVAWWAHAGGFICGVSASFIWKLFCKGKSS
jgi:membrane associated rhomboid family serine protease